MDPHRTFGRIHHTGDKFEHRAFAAAVAADERDRFAGLDGEGHVLQSVELVKEKLMFQQFYGVFFQRLGLFLCQVEPHRDVIHLNDGHRGNSLQIQNKVALQFAESRQAHHHHAHSTDDAGKPGVGAGHRAVHDQAPHAVDIVVQRIQLNDRYHKRR